MLRENQIQSILQSSEYSFGRSFDGILFHAFDDNQMPIGSPLSIQDYIIWLSNTYAQQPQATLQSIAAQYDLAIASAKKSPGILQEALANLIVSGAVFHALANPQENAPSPVAPTLPKIQPTVSTETPQKSSTLGQGEDTLLQLRAHILEEWRAPQTLHTRSEIEQHVATLIAQHTEQLQHVSGLTLEMREQELKKYERELSQQSLMLQSIEARLSHSTPTESSTTLPTPIHLDQLKAEETRLLQDTEHLKQNLASAGLTTQKLHHLQTQIQIIEQLIQVIQDETE